MDTRRSHNFPFVSKSFFVRYYIVITVFLAIFICVFSYIFLLSPIVQELKQQRSENSLMREAEQEKLSLYLKELEGALQEYATFTDEKLAVFKNILPEEEDLAGIFFEMQEIAKKNRLVVNSIEITPVSEQIVDAREADDILSQKSVALAGDSEAASVSGAGVSLIAKVKKLNVSLVILGGTYADLKNFLRDIEKNIRLFDVYDISFGSVNGGPFTINIRTYYLSS